MERKALSINVLTLFPKMFEGPFGESILKKAQEKGLVNLNVINIRDFATDKHRITDDYPFGGGAGMVLKPEPIFEAFDEVIRTQGKAPSRVVMLCPQGQTFTQALAHELAQEEDILFICGHYEGFDERIREGLVTDEISIGDYVLTGGELPAMVVIDAVTRLIPGVLGEEESLAEESFAEGLLEYPHYTRPREYRGMAVPDILLSGDHEMIRQWRRQQALLRTLEKRPDLLHYAQLSQEDRRLLAKEFEVRPEQLKK